MYTKQDVLKIAKRFQNKKRTYLLVDPLQGKHIPVSPAESLAMMETLGKQLADRYPSVGLVIGFAETATAIGACVAGCFSDCRYVQTTREDFFDPSTEDFLIFEEEHSHAVEQRLAISVLRDAVRNTDSVLLVDDEISTGKTLRNIVNQIRREVPETKEKRFICASIINRVSEENTEELVQCGIESDQLLKITCEDYDSFVLHYDAVAPQTVDCESLQADGFETYTVTFPSEPRIGVSMMEYREQCSKQAEAISEFLLPTLSLGESILVLGTEECMYPSLVLGRVLENSKKELSVRCHATTRSPIGICRAEGYPIYNGYQLPSFYDRDRKTFLYNIESYDTVIVITDAPSPNLDAVRSIRHIFAERGCKRFILLRR